MDGKRSIRSKGTDGSDHTYRQRVDSRYENLAATKNNLKSISAFNIVLILLAHVCCAFDYGLLEYGISLLTLFIVGSFSVLCAGAVNYSISNSMNKSKMQMCSILYFIHTGVVAYLLMTIIAYSNSNISLYGASLALVLSALCCAGVITFSQSAISLIKRD